MVEYLYMDPERDLDNNGWIPTNTYLWNSLLSFTNGSLCILVDNIAGTDSYYCTVELEPGSTWYVSNANLRIRSRRSNTTNNKSYIDVYFSYGGSYYYVADIGDDTSFTTYLYPLTGDAKPEANYLFSDNIKFEANGNGAAFNVDLLVSAAQLVITGISKSDAKPTNIALAYGGDPSTDGDYNLEWIVPYKSSTIYSEVYRSNDGGSYNSVGTDSTFTYDGNNYYGNLSLTDEPPGYNTYYVVNRSKQGYIASDNSSTTGVWVVYPPTNISFDDSNDDKGVLTGLWSAASQESNGGYEVSLRTAGVDGDWEPVGTTYQKIWTGLINGVNYNFTVRMKHTYNSTSKYAVSTVSSTEYVYHVLPCTNLNWDITNFDSGVLTGTWNKPSNNQDSFDFYLNNGTVEINIGNVDGSTEQFIVTGLSNKTKYKFRLLSHVSSYTTYSEYSPEQEVAKGWQGTICGIKNPDALVGLDEQIIDGDVCDVPDDNDV